jgi:heme o synthase
VTAVRPVARPVQRLADYLELTKPGITLLVLVTVAAGFYLGAGASPLAPLTLLATLVGAGLVAGGTNALNQIWERDADALMRRTRSRPLPAGRLGVREALAFAAGLSLSGLLVLVVWVNPLTAALAAATLVSYVLVYTPLKRVTTLNTLVGAVPGALPVVGGWTAAGGDLSPVAGALFWILFLWQLPHFLALAWLYRDDYRAGGFRMLGSGGADDESGETGRVVVLYALALLPVSLLPTLLGVTGRWYFGAALVLGVAYVVCGAAQALRPATVHARRLFFASVLYLPLLLFFMVVDKAAV